ncbi:MAG: hypothetical protein ACYC91_15990 [Solirubrobacteraceae bacterium]
MTLRDIRTHNSDVACDVCGRTLLRGERAEVYLHGGTRRSVCELCKSRALHEGWVREGTVPAYDGGEDSSERRRSLLSRLRSRRESEPLAAPVRTLGDELDSHAWTQSAGSGPSLADTGGRRIREPRHVRAVPAGLQQKAAAAVELFNGSEHRRTVAGVARSLGVPSVAVAPSSTSPSLVSIVAAWELCWYRYGIDLSGDEQTVRVDGQGYELDELDPSERAPNAVCDEQGRLTLA